MLKIKSLKKTYLLGLTAIIILVLAVISSLFGINNIALAEEDEDEEIVKVYEGFVYEDEAEKIISGFNLLDEVTGNFEVIIPDGVTAIGNNVFENLEKLKGVTLNKKLKTIGNYAFANTSISFINIPNTVTNIGEHAFDGCTALTDIEFESGRTSTSSLSISTCAFANCQSMLVLRLPDNTMVNLYAFDGCTSLLWVYIGSNCRFFDMPYSSDEDAAFFPTNTSITFIFPSKTEYTKMLNWSEKIFRLKHWSASTYIIQVRFHIEGSSNIIIHERLYNQKFNYVPDTASGVWNTDTAYEQLPVQDEAYSSTVWYTGPNFETAVDYEGVNGMLKTAGVINLYCHETITTPTFPTTPVSWVYSKDTSYNIDNISEVLKALDCQQTFTEKQLKAFDISIVFADENGKPADTPNKINRSGVYSVNFSLKPEYGTWTQNVSSSLTVNVNTNNFTTILIVLIVVGVVAVVVTVSTLIIRIKMQKRNKKKHLSQEDILKKFKDIGGKTDLK